MDELEEAFFSGAVSGRAEPDAVANAVWDAIAIDAPNAFLCILGEHLHLNRCFGRGRWEPYRVTTREVSGRIYDRFDLRLGETVEHTVWFDITASIARWSRTRSE